MPAPQLVDYLGLILTPAPNPAPGDLIVRGQSGGWTTLPINAAPGDNGSVVLGRDPVTGLPAWEALSVVQLPAPSGSAAIDGTNLTNAITKGNIVVAQAAPPSAPYLLPPDHAISFGDGCGLVGQGNPSDTTGGTTFKATGASSALVINGSGPTFGHFAVDGAKVTNYPLQIGTIATTFPAQRVFLDIEVANAILDGVTFLYAQNCTWIGGTINESGRDGLHFDGGTGGHAIYGIEILGSATTARYGVYMSAAVQPDLTLGLFDQPSRILFSGGRSEMSGVAGLMIDNAFGCTFDNFDMVGTGNFWGAAVAVITTANTALIQKSTSHVFRDVGFSGGAAGNKAIFVDTNCEATLDGQCNDWTGGGANVNTGGKLRKVSPTIVNGPVISPFPL